LDEPNVVINVGVALVWLVLGGFILFVIFGGSIHNEKPYCLAHDAQGVCVNEVHLSDGEWSECQVRHPDWYER
jgi:hypothetical protein